MNFFALVEILFRAMGIWEGLVSYVQDQTILKMRQDLNAIHDEEAKIEAAQDKNAIYSAQSTITKHSD